MEPVILHRKELLLPDNPGTLFSINTCFNIHECEVWLFVSIKNRKFTKKYLDWFVKFSLELDCKGYICPVDQPYMYNKMAELNLSQLTELEEEKICKLSSDVSRMAGKSINRNIGSKIKLISWESLEKEAPAFIKEELAGAYKAKGKFHKFIYEHVRSVKGDLLPVTIDAYAKFFLHELPVLIYVYYRGCRILDVYPGEQPLFIWDIENSAFEEELPTTTEYIKEGKPLLYLNTHTSATEE